MKTLIAAALLSLMAVSARAQFDYIGSRPPDNRGTPQTFKVDRALQVPADGSVLNVNTEGDGTIALGKSGSTTTMRGLWVAQPTIIGSDAGIATGIFASTVIPVTSSFESVLSSGVLILMTSTPNISTSPVVGDGSQLLATGTTLTLYSTAAVGGLIFQDEGTLTGSKLQLGAATRQVSLYKTLTLIFDAATGYWIERSYGNN